MSAQPRMNRAEAPTRKRDRYPPTEGGVRVQLARQT